ncbi:MAG: hypothetical protein ACJ73N_00245 [Bryobacteraceae bacterium]
MYSLRVLPGAALIFWSASLMFAQEKPSAPSLLPKVVSLSGGNAEEKSNSCKPLELLTAKELTFHQRTCFYGQKLLSKGMLGRATLFNGFAQFRNSPDMKDDGLNEFARRFSIYYARRTAQSTGELLAGYLNHEDPRFRLSQEHGFWKRTRSAIANVLVTTNQDGNSRPALAPIAGAFGSGLVGVACYRTNNTWEDGFRRTGFSYSTYFATALFREFQPELSSYASHFFHKRR